MEIVELILDEENEVTGIDAVSIVENGAIESNFVALAEQEIKLAKVDEDKRILMGAALIPSKPIFRKKGDEMFYVYFSKETVRRAAELFFKNGNQNNATLEHNLNVKDITVFESWIVEDTKMDKSAKYGLDVPVGTWMISMKVENDEVWNDYVKTGKVKGFSIEGYFADKAKMKKDSTKNEMEAILESEATYMLNTIRGIISNDRRTRSGKRLTLETYNDYPSGVSNNAKKGIELNEKVNNKCATQVGKIRATQLRDKKNISLETIKRMYSFLSRAKEYYDENDNEACGTISYLLWGGKAGLRWSASKLKELGEINLESMLINDDFAIIDDRLAYSTEEKAQEMAINIGCEGIHTHEFEGQTWYMPCEKHKMKKYKCPPGFKKDYVKHKCVKKKSSYAEVGPRGGIRKSPKAPSSGTPNRNPKGKGTAKGDASTSRGAKVSKADEAKLQKKSDEFNERYKEKLGYGVTIGQLKSVFQRGLGAFNVSHSPKIKSPTAWAMARVNAYLYLVKNGRPQNPKYTGDFDLLPSNHPKSPKK